MEGKKQDIEILFLQSRVINTCERDVFSYSNPENKGASDDGEQNILKYIVDHHSILTLQP